MGDPRKIRKKYQTPVHPWQKDRITDEIKLMKEYGLKNKKEIWKFSSFLKKYKDQAKKLIAMQGAQADKERAQMMDKLKSLGLINPGNETFDAIFSLELKDVLDRMLQTVLCKKGLARTIKQARQFIVHGHVLIGDKKLTIPRYLVPVSEEHKITFTTSSSLFSEDHPERGESKPAAAPVQAKEEKVEEKTEEAPVKENKETEEKPVVEEKEDAKDDTPKADEKPAESEKPEEKTEEK